MAPITGSAPRARARGAGARLPVVLGLLLACAEPSAPTPPRSSVAAASAAWRHDPLQRAAEARAAGEEERARFWERIAAERERSQGAAAAPAEASARARELEQEAGLLLAGAEVMIGYQAFDQERVRAARELLEQALELEPASAERQHLAGYAWFLAQDFDRARARFESAIELDPRAPRPWQALGTILLNEGQAERAREPLEEVARLTPDDANAHYVLGKCREELGEASGAEASYRRALELHPGLIEPYNRLGSLLVRTGREREGRRLLELFLWWKEHEKALRGGAASGPRGAPDLAALLARLEQRGAADPADARTLLAAAQVEVALGRADGARTRLREVRRQARADPDLLVEAAALWLCLGDPERAAALCAQALEAEPRHLEAHLALAALAARAGRAQVAREHYGAALALAPACASAREALATLAALDSNPEGDSNRAGDPKREGRQGAGARAEGHDGGEDPR